jgi:hypothetical protein
VPRVLRAFVIVAVIQGLTPGLDEVVETVVHLVATGRLAHGPEPRDPGARGAEHSCGVTLHTCSCCTGQPLTTSREAIGTLQPAALVHECAPPASRLVAEREPSRPSRPPIG